LPQWDYDQAVKGKKGRGLCRRQKERKRKRGSEREKKERKERRKKERKKERRREKREERRDENGECHLEMVAVVAGWWT
jgi:hypothetical protein